MSVTLRSSLLEVCSSIADGGGLILDGVQADGTPNTVRVEGNYYKVNGWARNPNASFVYDASYIKLREVAIHYNFSDKVLGNSIFKGATLSFVGSNLWIIHKNVPHADPESGLSSGNLQGFQSGVMPTTRNYGFNLKLNF